ncbi:PucR family transcriptional regulator [Clostridium paridis]|uniref:Helix-turn-helix domain-containing protein n=1 Tax=Clostridium paridis TaxID=2803863 RepID=A0A937FEF7_9CLOT|nr:helix-turn-helix domain-containing protein [Clostridium paridis]MBL4931819.1 helix-turn-helix domain-containing protein [Clostridium paridis]
MKKNFDIDNLNEVDIKLALYMQDLFDGFCSNKGLQYLIDKARERFNRPLILMDASGKLLASSYDAENVFQFITDENKNIFLSEDTLSLIYSNKTNDTLIKETTSNRTLINSIKIDIIEIGELVVYENGIPFQDIDFMLIDKVSALISAQLQKNILLNLDNNNLPNYLLADLIKGKQIDESIIENKQHYLKWARADNLYIMVIGSNRQETFDSKISTIFRTLKSYIPITQCIIYNPGIVAFIDQFLFDKLFNTNNSDFTHFLSKNNLYAGISQKYTLLNDSKKHYLNAVKAMEIGQKRNMHCSFFEDCTLYIIYELISTRYDQMDFCHPAVAMLMVYDKENGTNFLETLKQYIFYSSSPGEAAKILNIHRNTLFYRINKIKDMTGISLEHGDEICKIFISIRLLDIKAETP